MMMDFDSTWRRKIAFALLLSGATAACGSRSKDYATPLGELERRSAQWNGGGVRSRTGPDYSAHLERAPRARARID